MVRILFLACLFLFSCTSQSPSKEQEESPVRDSAVAEPIPRHVIIPAEGGATGFGYDIYMGDKLYIHQPSIPAVPGNKGFSTKEHADRAALFVVHKIRNNILPPAVSPEELDSLGVLD